MQELVTFLSALKLVKLSSAGHKVCYIWDPSYSGCNQICRLLFDMRNVMIFGENFLVDIHSFFLDCDPSKVDDTLEQ